ncbi:hypothetical protein PROPHIGD54-1_15 [Mycobacterium phage prophiGD54-1]|nr:hypothetical protein PROPHIGD102-2_15 [Mycobacterium phage prophi102-2]QSM03989.1 hypothetical protein PROPHIGD54-1_15 [Mycobacterium phage prophiGD54-1]SKX44603.1 Uncharacterised protein [Mycobacteroides abscessus subsp. abscessus]
MSNVKSGNPDLSTFGGMALTKIRRRKRPDLRKKLRWRRAPLAPRLHGPWNRRATPQLARPAMASPTEGSATACNEGPHEAPNEGQVKGAIRRGARAQRSALRSVKRRAQCRA